MKKITLAFSLIMSIAFCSPSLWAQNALKDSLSIPLEEKSVTKHVVTIDGKTINYTATAGSLALRSLNFYFTLSK